MTLERHLLKEATTLTFASWKAQVTWGRKTVKAYPNDLDVITEVVRRMGWDFKVDCIAERIAKGKVAAEKVKAIVSAPMMTMTELKAMIPIKWYCEQILKLTFSADNKCKCPFHNGKGTTSFVIDPKGGIFTCFGGCPPKEGKDHLTGDVIDLHQRAFNLASLSAAKQSLEQLDAGKGKAIPIPLFVTPAFEPKSKVDEELVSKVLMEDLGEPTISPNGATAADFAKLLLRRSKPEDKPIVFVNQKWPIIGVAARARLRQPA